MSTELKKKIRNLIDQAMRGDRGSELFYAYVEQADRDIEAAFARSLSTAHARIVQLARECEAWRHPLDNDLVKARASTGPITESDKQQ